MVLKKGCRIIVSACLLGVCCNYKAEASADYQQRPLFWESVCRNFEVFPVCPEQLGGMPTPRVPAELMAAVGEIIAGNGRVCNREGVDVTDCFLKGGQEVLRLAHLLQVDIAVLKSKSPSCGKKKIYDGTFSGALVNGSGVTAQLLGTAKIKVFDELEFYEACRGTFLEDFSV